MRRRPDWRPVVLPAVVLLCTVLSSAWSGRRPTADVGHAEHALRGAWALRLRVSSPEVPLVVRGEMRLALHTDGSATVHWSQQGGEDPAQHWFGEDGLGGHWRILNARSARLTPTHLIGDNQLLRKISASAHLQRQFKEMGALVVFHAASESQGPRSRPHVTVRWGDDDDAEYWLLVRAGAEVYEQEVVAR